MTKLLACLTLILFVLSFLAASQVFPEPITVHQSNELRFAGGACARLDGGYDMIYIQPDDLGLRKVFFQSFDADDQPLATPVFVNYTQDSSTVFGMEPALDGGYYFIAHINNSAHVYQIDSDGNYLSRTQPPITQSYGYRIFPDELGGLWLSNQSSTSSSVVLSYYSSINNNPPNGWSLAVSSSYGTYYDLIIWDEEHVLALVGTQGNLKLMKIHNEDGIVSEQILISEALSIWNVKLFAQGGELYLIYSHAINSGTNHIKILRLDTNLQPVWPQAVTLLTSEYAARDLDIIASSENEYLAAIALGNLQIKIGRFDAEGTVNLSDSMISYSGQVTVGSLKLTRIDDQNATLLSQSWATGWNSCDVQAVLICEDGFVGEAQYLGQSLPMQFYERVFAMPKADAARFVYMKRSPDNASICEQSLAISGNLSDESLLKQSQAGYVRYPILLPMNENLFNAWISLDYYAQSARVRYQIITTDGQPVFPQAGSIPVSNSLVSDAIDLAGVSLPDGSVCIAWMELSPVKRLRAQLFDDMGSPQWLPEGIEIAVGNTFIESGAKFALGLQAGMPALAWGDGTANLRIQVISENGELVFGAGGAVLLSPGDMPVNEVDRFRAHAVEDGKVIYSAQRFFGDFVGNHSIFMGLKELDMQRNIDGFGTPLFWPYPGTYQALRYEEHMACPDGILVRADQYEIEFDPPFRGRDLYDDHHQYVDVSGVAHWGDHGIMSPTIRYLAADTEGFFYSRDHYNLTHHLGKRDYAFEEIFEQEFSNKTAIAAAQVSETEYIAIDYSLRHFVFTPSGDPAWPEDSWIYEPQSKDQQIMSLAESAFVTWTNQNYTGLYLQKLNASLVGVADELLVPAAIRLDAVYPNPFKEALTLQIESKYDAVGKLEIFNIRGQLVARQDDLRLAKGTSHFAWNGKDERGRDAASGVYILRLMVDGQNPITQRTLKLK